MYTQANKQTGQCCRQRLCSLSFLFLFFINLYFKKHQSECLFKVVTCSNSGCAMMLRKRDMKTFETLQCSWRKVNCEYCQESVIMNQKQVCDRSIQSILSTSSSVILSLPLFWSWIIFPWKRSSFRHLLPFSCLKLPLVFGSPENSRIWASITTL